VTIIATKEEKVTAELKVGADTHEIVLSTDGKPAYVSVRKEHVVTTTLSGGGDRYARRRRCRRPLNGIIGRRRHGE
jgi:hypothetical protein